MKLKLIISIIFISFALAQCIATSVKDISPHIIEKEATSDQANAPEPNKSEETYATEASQSYETYAPEASQSDEPYAPEASQSYETYAPGASESDEPYAPEASQSYETYAQSYETYAPGASQSDEPYAPEASQSDETYAPEASQSDESYAPEPSQFSSSDAPIYFPPSDAPSPTSDDDNSDVPSSFSDAYSDILKGSLHDPPSEAPEPIDSENKPQSPALQQICGRTDYPDVCLATVTPLLKGKFEAIKVLEASLKACSLQIKLTINKVTKHAARSPELADALSECKDKYLDALESIQKAMDCIPSRDLGTITVTLSAVMADVSSCESAFEDLKSPSVMSKSDGLVSITVRNCLSIASLVHK